jgi:hypothetical protein
MERNPYGVRSVHTPELGKKTAEVLKKTLSVEAAASFAGVSVFTIKQSGFAAWANSPWGRDENMREALEFYKKKTKDAKTKARQERMKPLIETQREFREEKRGYKYMNGFDMSGWLIELKLQCKTKTSTAKKIKSISDEYEKFNEQFERSSEESRESMYEELYILKGKVDTLKRHFQMKYCGEGLRRWNT